MSANNWTECPKCFHDYENQEKALSESYGNVSEQEYLKMKKASKQSDNQVTLRENYQIGIKGNEFLVSYMCSCSSCGFHFEYSTTQKLNI